MRRLNTAAICIRLIKSSEFINMIDKLYSCTRTLMIRVTIQNKYEYIHAKRKALERKSNSAREGT